MDEAPLELTEGLRRALAESFLVRVSMRGRRSGRRRVVETTFVWDKKSRIYLSGYPGARDWVANMRSHPSVIVHTVEGRDWFDIPGEARVVRSRDERIPHVLGFIDRWASRGGAGLPFRWTLKAIRINHRLGLPWWGPFYLARRVLDRMPCVEITLSGKPIPRPSGPPAPTGSRR
ncbi:MAG: hypothetical protein WD645_06555 [Dehalococcoidia bacterium]